MELTSKCEELRRTLLPVTKRILYNIKAHLEESIEIVEAVFELERIVSGIPE